MLPAPAGTMKDKSCNQSPLVTHEEVVNQPQLFLDTLMTLHSSLGTRFMVPVIGKRELDLHVLYVEVTKRGGYDKVVLEKKWREIGSVLKFGPTTTSASFVLKKHYHTLLYKYEQVYFFNSNSSDSSTHLVSASRSITAVGTIVGKFDCGYLVTVKLGTEVLRGVIYHPDEQSTSSGQVTDDFSMAIVPYNPNHTRSLERKRRKRKRWGGDPDHPKPNRSGYNFFFAEKHSVFKSLYPNRERDFTKMIGESWNNLSPEERSVYQDIGLRDKERYRRELKEYHDRLAALESKDG